MKLRYFLRGLGAGIIFAVLIVGILGGASEKETLTDNEIIARARELGMVTKDEELDESLSQIMDNQKTDNGQENTVSKDSDGTVRGNDDSDSESNKETGTADARRGSADKESEAPEEAENKDGTESVAPEPLEEEETKMTFKITISPGMSSAQVSRAFEQMGLVDDAEAFDDYLCNNDYASRICAGTFTIEGKPGYAELAGIIATK